MFAAVAAVTLLGIAAAAQQRAAARPRPGVDWPAFRGIDATGVVAEGQPTPTTFSPASAVWRTKIPGLGNSSPIVWGDLLCVTTAISEKDNSFKPGLYGNIEPVNDSSPHEWKVMCLDKRTGAARWEQTVHKGVPAVKRHPKSTQANATLATDGTHLVAFFGSEGLHVYDLSGKRLWSKNFGVLDSGFFETPEAQWGFASSPVIHNGVDHSGRRSEELVPGGFRRGQRQGTLEGRAQRCADLGDVIGDGLTLVRREYPTAIGPVDLLLRDPEGGTIAVEVKRRGDIDGVEQLTRYLELLGRDPHLAPVTGVFAAQEIKPQAKVLAADRGIRCVTLDYEGMKGIESGAPRLF
jgi:hypothetical protein